MINLVKNCIIKIVKLGDYMNANDFNKFMKTLRYLKDQDEAANYLNYNLGYYNIDKLNIEQIACINQRLKSIYIIELGKKYFNFELDYSPKSIVYIDTIIDALTDLEIIPIFNIPFSNIVNIISSLRLGKHFTKQADQLFQYYMKKNGVKSEVNIESIDASEFIPSVLQEIITNVSTYLGETYIINNGGEWDYNKNISEKTDFISVTNKDREFNCYQIVLNRFFKSNLPLSLYWIDEIII